MSLDDTLLSPDLENYLQSLFPHTCPVLDGMHALAREKDFPIVGPLVGKLLRVLTVATGANRIFEMGSGFGYSAYWFLQGLPPGGSIVLTDGSSGNKTLAEGFLRPFDQGRVTYEVGVAQDILPRYDGPFDIVYVDVDKEGYPDCVDLAHDKLRPGGLLIHDNMLWFGRVWDGADDRPSTQGIRRATEKLSDPTRWHSTLIPLRDGVTLSAKRG